MYALSLAALTALRVDAGVKLRVMTSRIGVSSVSNARLLSLVAADWRWTFKRGRQLANGLLTSQTFEDGGSLHSRLRRSGDDCTLQLFAGTRMTSLPVAAAAVSASSESADFDFVTPPFSRAIKLLRFFLESRLLDPATPPCVTLATARIRFR